MLSPSQYVTPDRGRGLTGLKDTMTPRGPNQLFGLGGGSLLRQEISSLTPEYTSTPALPPSGGYTSSSCGGGYSSPAPAGYSSPIQGAYNADGGSERYSSPNQQNAFNHQGGASWTTRAEIALNAPTIWQKCEDLAIIMESCPLKELSVIWHNVVERLFMVGGGRGWGVGQIQRSLAPRDYSAISSFLSANGPLLSAANKLLADPYIRFEWPVSRLSPSIMSQVSTCSATLPSFISARLSHNMQHLSLNSFEFYMFTFSYYIVQPYSPDNKLLAGESAYPFILENYLSYYLPCDGTTPPSLPYQHHSGSPTLAQPQLSPDQGKTSTTPSRKSLLRHPASSVTSPVSTLSSARSSMPSSVGSSSGATDQVWRSETLLSIFSTVWLTQFSARPSSPGTGLSSSDLTIPVSDTLKIVRMLIKHLHYFSNSGGHHDVTPLDQLKRATLPGIKTQMYSMFKYIFTHWPHDTSFRIVLETWLSFIQPWRYTDRARGSQDTDPVPINAARWQLWVSEYILFYTEILKLVLPRFFRMDLTASRNAYMLFRISKVLSQPGVPELMKIAEASLDRGNRGQFMPSLLDSDGMTLDQDRELVNSAAKQCLLELEGHSVKYAPVFGNEFRQTVVELLGVAERAKDAAGDTLQEIGDSRSKDSGAGTISSWITWLLGSGDEGDDSQEVDDLKKTVQHLGSSVTGLGEVFSVAPANAGVVVGGQGGVGACQRRQGGSPSPNTPEMVKTENGFVLTPHGRWQVLQGLAKPVIKYEGDPDTRPITQQEFVVLVRMFHQASLKLNKYFGTKLGVWYNDAGVQGQVARMLLAAPTNFYTVSKSISGGPSTRQLHHHSARISLRMFADKRVSIYFIGYLLFMWLCGYSTFGAILFGLFLSFLILISLGCVRQVTQPRASLLDTSDLYPDSPITNKKNN